MPVPRQLIPPPMHSSTCWLLLNSQSRQDAGPSPHVRDQGRQRMHPARWVGTGDHSCRVEPSVETVSLAASLPHNLAKAAAPRPSEKGQQSDRRRRRCCRRRRRRRPQLADPAEPPSQAPAPPPLPRRIGCRVPAPSSHPSHVAAAPPVSPSHTGRRRQGRVTVDAHLPPGRRRWHQSGRR